VRVPPLPAAECFNSTVVILKPSDLLCAMTWLSPVWRDQVHPSGSGSCTAGWESNTSQTGCSRVRAGTAASTGWKQSERVNKVQPARSTVDPAYTALAPCTHIAHASREPHHGGWAAVTNADADWLVRLRTDLKCSNREPVALPLTGGAMQRARDDDDELRFNPWDDVPLRLDTPRPAYSAD
jgi:hypothetical protein